MLINYIAILVSIGIIILKRFSDKICQLVQLLIRKRDSPDLIRVRDELKQLKLERDSINMMDEFAKYAKIDRKINKLNDELQVYVNQMRSGRLKYTMYIKGIIMFMLSILTICLIWTNFDKPIIDFTSIVSNEEVVEVNIFYPLNYFLAFPCTNRLNSIGVTFWMFILNKMIDIGFNKFAQTNPLVIDTEKSN